MTDSVQRLGIPIGAPARSTCSLDRSYVRTDGRTHEESWLRTRDHLTFRNARAHIRISALGIVGSGATAGGAS